MTNEIKTRQIQPDRTIGSLFPTRFLKPAQLIAWKVTSLIVKISRVVEEEVQPKPGQTEWKTVIYFKTKNGSEYPQGYLLSAKIDSENLASATKAELIQELPGKQIKIHLAEYRGKSVLRIDAHPVTSPAIAETRPELPEHTAKLEAEIIVGPYHPPAKAAEEEPPEPEVITDSPQGEEYGF